MKVAPYNAGRTVQASLTKDEILTTKVVTSKLT